MAVHTDLGGLWLGGPLARDLDERVTEARQRLERRICEKALAIRRHSRGPFYIVRWQEVDANTFRWMAQVFEPGMEQEAQALATEKQGELEIVEFKETVPDNLPKEFLLDAEAKI